MRRRKHVQSAYTNEALFAQQSVSFSNGGVNFRAAERRCVITSAIMLIPQQQLVFI